MVSPLLSSFLLSSPLLSSPLLSSPLFFSPDVWSRMGLSLFLPEPSLPTRNCVGCKYSSTLTSGLNNTDENKKLRAGKRSDNWQSSHSTLKEHEVFILSEPKEHILVLRLGVAWKASTQMLHEHNNSSHLSLLSTGIPLASAVSSLCCACVGKL